MGRRRSSPHSTMMDDADVAVLIPDLSRHVDVMEIIAGDFLREAFHLSDGDEVSIHLIMPDGDPPTHR